MAEGGAIPILRHEILGSTNDEAMRLARGGERGPIFVTARSQTGGRGRQNRVWSSPPGNLYASLLLSDPAPLAVLPQLGFVAGVALGETLRHLLRDDPRLRLKWPNDALFDGAKLAGLLLETSVLAGGRVACVIGFGVNCQVHPDGLAYRATNLSAAAGRVITAEEVVDALGPRFAARREIWDRGTDFAAIRTAWLALAAGLGAMITVQCSSRTVTGRFKTLDASGHLLVETSEGDVAIAAGDVFLPG